MNSGIKFEIKRVRFKYEKNLPFGRINFNIIG